ncbi:MAG: DUF4838 domain-containing protein, partial [Planctomycetaceae bacterium]|nr:DUF4838 domain-containing protein [Planctomycetaceae bacterium]
SRLGQPSRKLEVLADRAVLPLIAADGTALPILLAEGAPPHTKAAAVTLADCLERIGGVRPEIHETLPDPLPAKAIWVGYQPALAAAFPGVDFTFHHPEEIVLAANENHVALTGRDKWDPKFSTVEGRRRLITDAQQEYGTANAVFTFLQERVGIRWLYPGETGTDYPGSESLNITPFTLRYHPQIRDRSGVFNQLERGYIKANPEQDWTKHQRLLLDSFSFEGGHYFKHWWEKYGETRPELFALQPDGTRGTHPKDPQKKKLCEGEPLVWQTWLVEQAALLDAYPYHDVLYTMPNDGYFDGHCTDPRSRAWDPDPSETDLRVRISWGSAGSEEWPPLSDRYVHFANKLSELASERFPNHNCLIMMNAYGEVGKPVPVKARPRDDILVVSVHNFFLRHKAMRTSEKQQFAEWAKICNQIYWRPNLGNQGGTQTGYPDVPFQQAIEDVRYAAEHGVMGIYFDALFEHWAPNAPFYYLLSQLAWNPYADGDAILDDYYHRCYGPAAEPMKAYWELMAQTRQTMVDTVALPRVSLLRSPSFFTPEVFQRADALIAQAVSAVADADPKYAQRIAFTKSGLDHTRAFVAIRALMQRAEDNPRQRDAIYTQVLAKWTEWEQLARTFPSHAINTKRLGFDPNASKAERKGKASSNPRIMGFHPDAPVSKRALREMFSEGLDLE